MADCAMLLVPHGGLVLPAGKLDAVDMVWLSWWDELSCLATVQSTLGSSGPED